MTAPSRSLLIVNYHSAALTQTAISSARAAGSAPLQVVVIDNSCSDAEAERLAACDADELILASRNLGYAGGINAGAARCSGDVVLAANPDVRFARHAVDELVAATRMFAVAGPRLTWDEGHSWILPPSDLHRGSDALSASIASRSAAWRTLRDRKRFFARLRFWKLDRPTRVDALSGAVLAIRRDVLREVGGFDERFPLYFEETDFLRRVALAGHSIGYMPAAIARHVYNQSAGPVAAEAGQRFAYSEEAYLSKWNGPRFARAVRSLRREVPGSAMRELREREALTVARTSVIEASPLPTFATAAGHLPTGTTVHLPDDVAYAYHGDVLYLREVDAATGRVVATYARRRVR
jgi:GT2 family glycosyltransferase